MTRRPAVPADWSLRRLQRTDLPDLVDVQERGAVLALADVFPQAEHPFPREAVRAQWELELADPAVAAYAATGAGGRLLGFAARRDDRFLHFGTDPETWGTGLAGRLHDALLTTYPPDVRRLRLWVFAGNRRARRFYEKLGWTATGGEASSTFPPRPTLLEYVLDRPQGV